MLTAILLPLLAVSAPHPAPKVGLPLADPPVKVWLNDDRFVRGDRARVYVKTDRDGYVVVLHAEPDGRVRVLFPLDPTDDNFVQAGKTYEVRGRGDRDAFTAYDSRGTGAVFAAYSPDPFRFDGFVRQDHWDYRVEAFRVGDDPEADLTELARQMAGGAEFEYDLVRYDVSARVAYRSSYNDYYGGWYGGWYDPWYRPWRSGIYIGFSIGRPWYYSPGYYDPWYYDPWYDPYYYRAAYYRPYSYGYWDPWWYRPYGYRTTVIYTYGNSYYGYPYNGYGYRAGTLAPQRYTFNYVQPGRRTLSLYDPSRNVINAGRRSVLPPTDIVVPAVAVPRVRDAGPMSPATGRRAEPQSQGPARGVSDQPRRTEPTTPGRRTAPEAREPAGGTAQPRRVPPTTPARESRGLVPVGEGRERAAPRTGTDRTRSIREVSPTDRAPATREPRQYTPSRPEVRQPESNARPQLERRSAPERRDTPSQARPSEPRARSPQSSPPRSSSPPRASSPPPRSGGSSAPRAAPRAPSGGGRSAPPAPSSGRRRG